MDMLRCTCLKGGKTDGRSAQRGDKPEIEDPGLETIGILDESRMTELIDNRKVDPGGEKPILRRVSWVEQDTKGLVHWRDHTAVERVARDVLEEFEHDIEEGLKPFLRAREEATLPFLLKLPEIEYAVGPERLEPGARHKLFCSHLLVFDHRNDLLDRFIRGHPHPWCKRSRVNSSKILNPLLFLTELAGVNH
jgi:hypothetical protein